MKEKNQIEIRILLISEYDKAVSLHVERGIQHISKEGLIWQYHSESLPFSGVIIGAFDGTELVATQAFIPLVGCYKGRQILTAKSEYTLVNPNYRGMEIFERMYEVGVEWAEHNNISVIWGFTNAVKPFKRVGFSIGGGVYTQTILLRPVCYFMKKFFNINIVFSAVRLKDCPLIQSSNQSFGLLRTKNYLKYRYDENPFRGVVWFDETNGVLYTASNDNSGIVYVSEVVEGALLEGSIKLFKKKFRGKFLIMQRVTGTSAPSYKNKLTRTTESNVKVVCMWLDKSGEGVPSFNFEEGYSQGV